jgi:monoamine oxidase
VAATINRRRFLQLSVAAAPPLLFQRPRPSNAPVVIVGAGLAGLRAATVLQSAGREVVVLEARPRPGGRVLTIRSTFDDGLYAEAGAIRIPSVHKTVLRVVREHRLTLLPFESSVGSPKVASPVSSGAPADAPGSALRSDEKGLSARALLDRYVGTLPSELGEASASPDAYARWREYDRLTWPAWLLSRKASPEAVRLMTLGGDSRDLSALWVLRQFAMLRGSNVFFKISGGMDRLPNAMATALGAAVRYGAAVVRVSRETAGATRVEYETRGRVERVTASHVVLTVPFSTLRQIEIRPRFSQAKERAIESLEYYAGVRILLQSRNRFWTRAGLNGSARTERAEIWDCTYERPVGPRGILGATTGGSTGRQFLDLTTEASEALGVDVVAEAFPEIRSSVEKAMVLRWPLEPWSRGAFAIFRPGQMTAMMPEISRPEEGVFFAGEHTSSWMGWMEGALESGERAAREVLAS